MDCDRLYESVITMRNEPNDSLFRLAQCFIDGYDIGRLSIMLRSDDVGIVLDGLFVSEEIGGLISRVTEDLANLGTHSDLDVRERAHSALKLASEIGTQ